MTIKEEVLCTKVQHLLASLAQHASLHFIEAETDLAQTNLLLQEAIDKLSSSFMGIHEAVATQQSSIDQVLAGAMPTPAMLEVLKASQANILTNVYSAITGLQFQDMTSQLIGRTIRRISALQGIATVMSADKGLVKDVDHTIALVDNVSLVLDAHTREADSILRKAVHQTHMESGDIELF